MNPIFMIDFYKVGHVVQYPSDVTQVWSNWTPRYTHVKGQETVVHFGLQYFIKKVLVEQFDREFFHRPIAEVLEEYREVIKATLGKTNPKTDHIERLHDEGFLPITVYSIPEGFSTPLRVPSMVITNTKDHAFWVPNYLETMLSAYLWRPSTSATTAQRYRDLFKRHAVAAGETDFSFIDWMGHDFSMRGMGGIEDAILSGMGHLLSFAGTDTVPAILAAQQYYGAPLEIGGSVDATEHSVMCAAGKDSEFETFQRLLTEVYPEGIVSVVSDTWDLWKVLTDFVPRLKEVIHARNGKLVIRPDSGDPVKIICGAGDSDHEPARMGTLRLLAQALGVVKRDRKLDMIRNAGAIYGDSITLDRADRILSGITKAGFSPYNMVFGIGSYTYAYVTRDTYGFAMKATAVRRGGKVIPIMKDPVTDPGGKRSLNGIPVVWEDDMSTVQEPAYFVTETDDPSLLDKCSFVKVFNNGRLLVDERFEVIRMRARRFE